MSNADPLLDEQLEYYRARAQEYDESVQQTGRFAGPGIPVADHEWAHTVDAIHALGPIDRTLELACGTGLWTQELIHVSKSITALDGAPEMLDANKAKLQNPQVLYQQADLFNWQPTEAFDLVFFAFWISHVPFKKTARFFEQVARATKPGGRVFFVDEPASGKQLSGPVEGAGEQTRSLHNGSTFRIVKVYHDPQVLAAQLREVGFVDPQVWVGDYYFNVSAVRR
jgi:demethylmenaquinone methyltransferase/2-methoxy-6-polyprenyl-1,4-benzoquinol methylase